MVKHHVGGVLFAQHPYYEHIAHGTGDEEDAEDQQGHPANDDGDDGGDDAQDDAGHEACHHIGSDVHGFVAMGVGSEHLPYHAIADGAEAPPSITSPGDAMDEFVEHHTRHHDDHDDTPIDEELPGGCSLAITLGEALSNMIPAPNQEEEAAEKDQRAQEHPQCHLVGLDDVDGHRSPAHTRHFRYLCLFHGGKGNTFSTNKHQKQEKSSQVLCLGYSCYIPERDYPLLFILSFHHHLAAIDNIDAFLQASPIDTHTRERIHLTGGYGLVDGCDARRAALAP